MLNLDLETYIKHNLKDINSHGVLLSLYREFSSLYVHTIEDLKTSPQSFAEFAKENIEMIAKYSKVSVAELLACLPLLQRTLKNNCSSPHNLKTQNHFVNAVHDLVPNTDIEVLDIGPGEVPISSILLGEKYSHVTAMDLPFLLPNTTLENLNVTGIPEYLNKNHDISKHNLVVGRVPCTAIDTIVYLCQKYNKSYFIETCSCDLPSMTYFRNKWNLSKNTEEPLQQLNTQKKPNPYTTWSDAINDNLSLNILSNSTQEISWTGWQNLLPLLDKNIKFDNNYAYNIKDNIAKKHFNTPTIEK